MTLEEMRKQKTERGYSCEWIAQKSGVPLGTVQKIFAGVTLHPRFSTLQALETIFREEKAGLKESETQGADTPIYEFGNHGDRYGSFLVEESTVPYLAGKKQGEYTIKEYYGLPRERRVELIDGVFYDMEAPTFVHQGVVGELHRQIANFIRANKGECVARVSSVDVRLDCDDRTMVQPDVLIVCDRRKIMRWGIMGAPDFLAEVISPSTIRKDSLKKLTKYLNAGVREYWMIDPDNKVLMVYNFEDDNMMLPPFICGLTGKVPVGIYQGRLEIDLDMVAEMIEEYPYEDRE